MATQNLKNKSENALRTIGEAAKALAIPAHVIRFWETKFTNLKPVKFNGRRYYSPQNIDDLKNIHNLLHQQKYSIEEAVAELTPKKSRKKIITKSAAAKITINNSEKTQELLEKLDFSILIQTRERLDKAKERLAQIL